MRWSQPGSLAAAGWLRIAVGGALLDRPAMLPKAVGVDSATARKVGWLGSMVGVRDVALGAGLLHAVHRRADPRPWLVAQAVADAVDALAFATAVARGHAAPLTGGGAAGVAALASLAEVAALQELAGER